MRAILAFVFGALLCAPLFATTKLIDRGDAKVFFFRNEAIATSSYLEKAFDNVGGLTSLEFSVASVSSGSVSTANVVWLMDDGSTLNTQTLTSHTPITYARSDYMKIQLYSNVTASVTITGNVIIKK
jgi:hypothetical protein